MLTRRRAARSDLQVVPRASARPRPSGLTVSRQIVPRRQVVKIEGIGVRSQPGSRRGRHMVLFEVAVPYSRSPGPGTVAACPKLCKLFLLLLYLSPPPPSPLRPLSWDVNFGHRLVDVGAWLRSKQVGVDWFRGWVRARDISATLRASLYRQKEKFVGWWRWRGLASRAGLVHACLIDLWGFQLSTARQGTARCLHPVSVAVSFSFCTTRYCIYISNGVVVRRCFTLPYYS